MQFLSGVGSGTFIPLTLPIVLRTLPPRFWAYGIAVYALNLELSLNISASLEAWYIDHLSWHFIFWQNVPLAIAMIVCLLLGLPRDPTPERPTSPHLLGVSAAAIGLALIFAAIDQGNRLDWLSSGTIIGLLTAGGILLLTSLIHLALVPSSWFAPSGAFRRPLPVLLLNVLVLRLTVLSTAFLIPQFLISVRGFRSLEVGQALIWIALPQLITAPIAALLLRRTDSRWIACGGLVCIGAACWVVAHGITPDWGPQQFLPTQLLQALGQSLALSGVVFTSIQHLQPKTALTFGAMIQSSRLMGGEVGLAATMYLVRVTEQHASNRLGQHVIVGDPAVVQRLNEYALLLAPQSGGLTQQRASALLGGAVRQASELQSFIDAFIAIAAAAAAMLLVLLCMDRAPEGPASYRRAGRRTA
jgi:DHA2 family multidrug resistance protein